MRRRRCRRSAVPTGRGDRSPRFQTETLPAPRNERGRPQVARGRPRPHDIPGPAGAVGSAVEMLDVPAFVVRVLVVSPLGVDAVALAVELVVHPLALVVVHAV